jgi:hypothetical protein
MTNEREEYTEQEIAWGAMYDDVQLVMSRYGVENAFSEADYWLLDDNWGPQQHVVFINNLGILTSQLVLDLQAVLARFPDWEIVVTIAVLKPKDVKWPEMGLYIRSHEIIDGLQRQYFPAQFRNIVIPNSRVSTDRD